MFRIAGAVLIIFAGSMLGFVKSDGLLKRARLLGKIITGLNLLKTHIGYGRRNLCDALSSIGKNHGIELFLRISEEMGEKGTKRALEDGISALCTCLSEGDKEPLFALGETLGMTDAKTQTSAIETAIITLSESKNEADEEYMRLGKMYRSVGVLGGILVAIIFI